MSDAAEQDELASETSHRCAVARRRSRHRHVGPGHAVPCPSIGEDHGPTIAIGSSSEQDEAPAKWRHRGVHASGGPADWKMVPRGPVPGPSIGQIARPSVQGTVPAEQDRARVRLARVGGAVPFAARVATRVTGIVSGIGAGHPIQTAVRAGVCDMRAVEPAQEEATASRGPHWGDSRGATEHGRDRQEGLSAS